MNVEILTQFCGRDDVRGWMNAPFAFDQFYVATDGRLLVAISAESPAQAWPELPEKVARLIGSASTASSSDGEWMRAEAIKLSDVKCFFCDGAGSVATTTCDDCDGEGYIQHGRHEYECKSCDGDGKHTRPGDDEPCGACKGTGIEALPSDFNLKIDDRTHSANSVYVALLRKLPNAELCAGLMDGGVIAVRFDGGFGALMPMRHNGAA